MRYSERFDHEVGQVAQFFVIEVLMFDSLIPHSRILPRPVTTPIILVNSPPDQCTCSFWVCFRQGFLILVIFLYVHLTLYVFNDRCDVPQYI